ncbi:MAG: peptidoglycan-associated lipoprotein Pal [Pseudomonadota bacterium]
MKFAVRLGVVLLMSLILAACATDTRDDDMDNQPEPPPAPVVEPEVDRVDPNNFADSRNLDNPQSLLSQREIYFDFDRSDVQARFLPVIEAHAAYMRANPSARVLLEGHADERGSREYNLGLGERRGNSVEDLTRAGGAGGNQLEVVSYGEERPVCRQSSDNCWERNRRVEIVYTAR